MQMYNSLNSRIKYIHSHSSIQHVHDKLKTNTVAELKYRRNTYLGKKLPATSYVTAMFHPTIYQCAHQSLSTTATLELGMIPTRNKGTLEGSHITKYISKFSQAKTTFGFIRLPMRWEAWTANLMSSTTELWTPAPDQAWLLKHLHTQHKESSPSLLHSLSGYAFNPSAI